MEVMAAVQSGTTYHQLALHYTKNEVLTTGLSTILMPTTDCTALYEERSTY